MGLTRPDFWPNQLKRHSFLRLPSKLQSYPRFTPLCLILKQTFKLLRRLINHKKNKPTLLRHIFRHSTLDENRTVNQIQLRTALNNSRWLNQNRLFMVSSRSKRSCNANLKSQRRLLLIFLLPKLVARFLLTSRNQCIYVELQRIWKDKGGPLNKLTEKRRRIDGPVFEIALESQFIRSTWRKLRWSYRLSFS